MDMDNGVGTDCGRGGVGWMEESKGENWDNSNRITIKYFVKRHSIMKEDVL